MDSGGTCWDNDSPLVGGHVGRRPILLIHVGAVTHGVGLCPCSDEFAAFVHATVYGGLPETPKETDDLSL